MSASLGSPVDRSAQRGQGVGQGVTLDELRGAWAAVIAGHFRGTRGRPATAPPAATSAPTPGNERLPMPTTPAPDTETLWVPGPHERVVPVLGAIGSCGATTLAVALAACAYARGDQARVVECVGLSATGLAAAAGAELGAVDGTEWVRGVRDGETTATSRRDGTSAGGVVLERAGSVRTRVDQTPTPPPLPGGANSPATTVLDVGWETGQVLGTPSWVRDQVLAWPGVVATSATGPGLRRLEMVLSMLPTPEAWSVAVLGPARRRWPKATTREVGPLTSQLLQAGRLAPVPVVRDLTWAGLTSSPLPNAVTRAAAGAVELLHGDQHPADPGDHPSNHRTAHHTLEQIS